MQKIIISFVVLILFLSNNIVINQKLEVILPQYDSDHEITYDNLLTVVRDGLPKAKNKKKIIIVGAGIAGLCSAYLLEQAGHEIVMIEASDHVGGRIKTHRDPSGWLMELGAMRIPHSNLIAKSFIQDIFKLEIDEFSQYDEETYIFVNGIRQKMKDYYNNPDSLGYNVNSDEMGKTADQLLDQALRPYVQIILKHGWEFFLEKYDHLSLRQVLNDENFSKAAIDMIGVLVNAESQFDFPLSEVLEIFYEINDGIKFFTIRGGNDLLPKRFLTTLNTTKITYNARAVRVVQNTSYHVIIEYSNRKLKTLAGDYVIMTPTPTALNFVQFNPPLSFRKKSALRQMGMGFSSKLVLVFSERFWEKEGIFGGKTITDLPSHLLHYSRGGSNFTGGLIYSYTWGKLSCQFSAIPEQDVLEMVLEDLVKIHGKHIRQFYINGLVKHWSLDPYSLGDIAYYAPLQRLQIHKELEKPADRIWFAGEYVSTPHGWIESAIKSALRTAIYISTDIEEL